MHFVALSLCNRWYIFLFVCSTWHNLMLKFLHIFFVGSEKEWMTGWWEQFKVLLTRGLKERKHESYSGLKIFQVLSVSILSGLLWWQSDTSHIQDQVLFSLKALILNHTCTKQKKQEKKKKNFDEELGFIHKFNIILLFSITGGTSIFLLHLLGFLPPIQCYICLSSRKTNAD